MKPAALIITLLLAVVACACSFGGTTALLTLTQPAAPGVTAKVLFQVQSGDDTKHIAERLQQQGVIRNATLFELLARSRGLDSQLRAGTYSLSPDMSMDGIMQVLITGAPEPGILIRIEDSRRVTQYPYLNVKDDKGKITGVINLKQRLPNFNADRFIEMAKTGKYPDGTDISKDYWFVPPKQPNTFYALEGYLYPDTLSFDQGDDEVGFAKRLLDEFGEQLCPGPKDDPGAYFGSKTSCLKHQAMIGKNGDVPLFDSLKKYYFTDDEVLALYRALTLSSIVIREAAGEDDLQGVTNVLYNRYAVSQGKMKWPSSEPVDTFNSIGADATAQYARDTDTPPSDPLQYWAKLQQAARDTDPNNLYNTNNGFHKGLPPGPIAAPYFDFLAAAANPIPEGNTSYFFYLHDPCGHIHYAITYAQFQGLIYRYSGNC
jgi:UPF0755 protein